MDILLLISRLLLGMVFVVAGIAKFADLAGSRRAMASFGIPRRLAYPLGVSLPVVEILIAAALIPLRSAWAGAIAALTLLLVFCIAIAINLVRGNAPDCHCFGQLHSEPVGWSTLTRNVLLVAVAGLIVTNGKSNPGISAVGWLWELKIAEVVGLILGTVVIALVSTTVVYMRRILVRQSTVLAKMEAMKKVIDEDYAETPAVRLDAEAPVEGLPVGSPAPAFLLPTPSDDQISLNDLLARRKPVLLLFVSPNCYPCRALFPLIKGWERDYGRRFTIALISRGSATDNLSLVEKYGATRVLVQTESGTSDQYRVMWTPAAVLIDKRGRIASEMAYGDDAIQALVSTASAAPKQHAIAGNGASGNGNGIQISEHSSLKIGDVVPHFSVQDVEGRTFSARDLEGRDTLLVFWDPQCPFCSQISEDLLRWEENPPHNAPRLVIVASGEAKRIEAESKRFASPYLHDGEFRVALMFGTSSTPSAVLIDRDRRIASSVAIGLPNALALLGIRKAALPIATVN